MWKLWIVSTIIGSAEPKLTLYAEFSNKLECQKAWYEVTSEFKENEVAFCDNER